MLTATIVVGMQGTTVVAVVEIKLGGPPRNTIARETRTPQNPPGSPDSGPDVDSNSRGGKEAQDFTNRDALVLEHLGLVRSIAIRVYENLPSHVDIDDLVHAGILGLFDAATRFDAGKAVNFATYAKFRIKGSIVDSLRQLDWASRDLRRRHKEIERITCELSTKLGHPPSEMEIAEKLGVSSERWRQIVLDLRGLGPISSSTRGKDQEDLPAPDYPCNPGTHPDSIYASQQLKGVVDDVIGLLPPRYRSVVSLYYRSEMTMKEIGGVLGINESRVSQIHKAALGKLAAALQATGITSSAAAL